MLSSLIYLSISVTLAISLQFKISRSDELLVSTSNGTFLPLCSSYANQQYLRLACSSDSASPSPVAVPIPLNGRSSLSIACVNGGSTCFSFPSPSCTFSLNLTCPREHESFKVNLCGPGEYWLSSRCFSMGRQVYNGYAEGKESCPIDVLSVPAESDRNTLVHILSSQTDTGQIYFTSAFRKGSQWFWDDGGELNITVTGSGRCLAVSHSSWVAVDCDSSGRILCQSGSRCIQNNKYTGTHNSSQSGQPCMKWNDPSLLFYGKVSSQQELWNHNYCRFIDNSTSLLPECFTSPGVRSPCRIDPCSAGSGLRDSTNKETCDSNSWKCDNGECISSEFRCDFEKDCADGSDEKKCDDYLQSFDLIGALRLTEKITEIWTFIPHVQGCAKRCLESSMACEAFSYQPKDKTCLLSDVTSPSNLVSRQNSLFYKKRFSSKDVLFSLNDTTLVATRNAQSAPVCNDNYSLEYRCNLCKVAGFGRCLEGKTARADAGDKASRTAWRIACLLNERCFAKNEACTEHIRCSNCSEAACSDGSCLSKNQLCDSHNDCADNSDESTCYDVSFRLSSGSESSGNVEVYFDGEWYPVCEDAVQPERASTLCRIMNYGGDGEVFSSVAVVSGGRTLECSTSECSVATFQNCTHQARIRCSHLASTTEGECGVRRVNVVARDPLKARLARVVGGFETLSGAFPWTAAIKAKHTNGHHCGASILDRTHLITAAHCFEDDRRPMSYKVIAGDWDNNITEGTEQIFTPIRFYFYPLYEDLFAHDIAIVEIVSPGFQWSEYVLPICLPSRTFSYDSGTSCIVSGWGSIGLDYPHRLQAATLPIIDRESCVSSSHIYQSMSRSAFCAGYLEGGIDSCQGDSGGPYACRDTKGIYVLAGVISWGDGCAQRNQPGIYTMVAPYLTWIEEIITKKA